MKPNSFTCRWRSDVIHHCTVPVTAGLLLVRTGACSVGDTTPPKVMQPKALLGQDGAVFNGRGDNRCQALSKLELRNAPLWLVTIM